MRDCWMAVEQKEQLTARFTTFNYGKRDFPQASIYGDIVPPNKSHAQSPNFHNQNFATLVRINAWNPVKPKQQGKYCQKSTVCSLECLHS